MHRSRGLSVSEIMISTAVIGTATVVAVPKFMHAAQRAKESALKYELKTLRKAVDQFYIDSSGYPDTVTDLLQEEAPKDFWMNNKLMRWNPNVKWQGPYVAYGENHVSDPLDPVSGKPFLTKRGKNGRLQIFSSAPGKDSEGKEFKTY